MPATSSAAEVARDRRDRRFGIVAATASAVSASLAFGMVVPLMTAALESRGSSAVVIGAATSASSIMTLVLMALMFTPRFPELLARVGAYRALCLGIVIMAGTVAALPLLPWAWAWILLRLVCGIGIGLHWMISESWINRATGNRRRGSVMALYVAAVGISFGLGPLLLEIVGIGGSLPFVITAVLVAASAVPVILARRLVPALPHRKTLDLGDVGRRMLTTLTAAFASGFGTMALFALLYVYLGQVAGGFEARLPLLAALTLGFALLQFPVGYIADRTRTLTLILASAALGLVLTLALPWLVQAPLLRWPAVVLLGGTFGAFYTLGLDRLGNHFGDEEKPAANAVFIFAFETGTLGGPVISGAAMDLFGPHALVATVALVVALLGATALWRHRNGAGAEEDDTPVS